MSEKNGEIAKKIANLRSAIDRSIDFKHALDQKDAESARLREEIAKWQKMCEEFVGCSMLSDEFADEPHEPESFGGYVKNLIGQIDSQSLLIEKLREALKPLAEPNLALRQDLPKFRKDAQEVLAILSQSEKKEGL